MIPTSVLSALFRSVAELSGAEGLHGAVPAQLSQPRESKGSFSSPLGSSLPLFFSLLGQSFPFISCLAHCRRAVIRAARASFCLHICVQRASSPADPDSLSDDPLPLPSFFFPVPPWISSPALPLTAARGSRVPEPGLVLGTFTRDEARQGWENKGQLLDG